jgi:hypothetical protein
MSEKLVSQKLPKKHFKVGENGVTFISNLTGIGPTDLNEIVISLTNRDVYISKDVNEMASKWGYLYISGYQYPKIINDFYKIMFDSKQIAEDILKEYAES